MVVEHAASEAEADEEPVDRRPRVLNARPRAAEAAIRPDDAPDLDQAHFVRRHRLTSSQIGLGLLDQGRPSWIERSTTAVAGVALCEPTENAAGQWALELPRRRALVPLPGLSTYRLWPMIMSWISATVGRRLFGEASNWP